MCRNNLYLHLNTKAQNKPQTNINSWKLLQVNLAEILSDHGLGKDFLDTTQNKLQKGKKKSMTWIL